MGVGDGGYLWKPEVRRDRTTDLLADFAGGYAKGWHMLVPAAFRDALDIRVTPRMMTCEFCPEDEETKKKCRRSFGIFTQGLGFNFQEHDIIYKAAPEVYGPECWSECLGHLEYAVRIIGAAPAMVDRNEGGGSLALKRGYLELEVLRPSGTGIARVSLDDCWKTDQVDFVHFLRTGEKNWRPWDK